MAGQPAGAFAQCVRQPLHTFDCAAVSLQSPFSLGLVRQGQPSLHSASPPTLSTPRCCCEASQQQTCIGRSRHQHVQKRSKCLGHMLNPERQTGTMTAVRTDCQHKWSIHTVDSLEMRLRAPRETLVHKTSNRHTCPSPSRCGRCEQVNQSRERAAFDMQKRPSRREVR
ncbi:hypothetical protein K437DRAFT_116668 [Tilletiaria anomala UBC 951]|uniref:Uncharacterized protein n=1 Tax=Tilletiaria anomala (strain ATCC 24038 / CBS 436.72 / UBC 951) TaxID=1037660 RepID=A0A066WQ36_TILAU|nr:uncharacterized protein K437DRAFT_116668 [Tilletiaria anomala UBC 951]KDN53119.1 hypothetical protein K437DRAFT_116668 [Tilletiaria anomala UBC 951]